MSCAPSCTWQSALSGTNAFSQHIPYSHLVLWILQLRVEELLVSVLWEYLLMFDLRGGVPNLTVFSMLNYE